LTKSIFDQSDFDQSDFDWREIWLIFVSYSFPASLFMILQPNVNLTPLTPLNLFQNWLPKASLNTMNIPHPTPHGCAWLYHTVTLITKTTKLIVENLAKQLLGSLPLAFVPHELTKQIPKIVRVLQ
jgi:hypothetical protein